ncbi:macrophage mannose receptor 1-like [Alosa pseudoharengus]|uniref:macrophage mannose receptor 1-like n=1 Tax=Alosa pseudoharengus TaxID=34774 RepID=UPI003F88638C
MVATLTCQRAEHQKLSPVDVNVCAVSSLPRQFHVVKEQKTWTEAQQYCREEFTDLATIDDMTEMEKVKSMIHEAGAGDAWIGLMHVSSPKWQWSLADRDFYRENEAEFRSCAQGQPNQIDEEYVVMKEHGKWHDFMCSHSFPFICYDENTDLASVRNQKENDQIEDVRGSRGAWIGLFRDAWEWSDGSSSSFRHWNTEEPNYVDREWELGIQSPTKWVQRWVRERAKGASTAHVWLGLRHACGLGWFWVCGETVCYNHWAPGQEQVESCKHRVGAVESGGGQWASNLTETDKLNFICTTEVYCVSPV